MVIAETPGIGKIFILFLIHSKTIKFPGSDTEGVPASEIIDTDLFFFNISRILGRFLFSLN